MMWVVPLCDIATIPHSPLTPGGELRKSFMKEFKSGKFVSLPNNIKKEPANDDSKYLMKKRKKNVLDSDDELPLCNKKLLLPKNEIRPYSKHNEVTDSENSEETKSVKLENAENWDPTPNEVYKYKKDNEISAYEKMILKNKMDKMAFLQSLKIDEIKQDLSMYSVKPTKRPRVKKIGVTPPPIRRKSLRLLNEKINYNLSEDAIPNKKLFGSSHELVENFSEDKPPNMKFEEALILDNKKDSCKNFAIDIACLSKETVFKKDNITYDSAVFKTMKVNESTIAKVVMSRITTMAIHPSSTKVLVAAGSKEGQIGLWDVESKRLNDGLYLFAPHSRNVSCLAFNPANHSQLFSSSYDGSFRCGDLDKMIFNEVYHSENSTCTYFDFLTSSTFLISQQNGSVVVVDSRTDFKKTNLKNHQCHNYTIKSINIHPVDKSYFMTASNNGIVSLWDLRKLQKTSVVDMKHSRCVNSAYFSPVTGNYILTTSTDDKIRIFDSKNMTEDIKMKIELKHNNYVTRWLTCFRASWVPNSEAYFTVGSMSFPRRIEVFNINCDIVHEFRDDDILTSVTSTNVFHPSRPVLCGGNSSGKVFVFMAPE